MSKVFRQGRVYNLYSEPITDTNELPHDYLVGTFLADSEEHFRAQSGYKGEILQKVTPANEHPRRMSSEALRAQMAGLPGMTEDKLNHIMKGNSGTVKVQPEESETSRAQPEEYRSYHTEIGRDYAEMEAQEKALQEFKLLLARYYANRKDEGVRTSCQAVGGFILRLWPDLKERLEEAKKSLEEPEFKL